MASPLQFTLLLHRPSPWHRRSMFPFGPTGRRHSIAVVCKTDVLRTCTGGHWCTHGNTTCALVVPAAHGVHSSTGQVHRFPRCELR